MYCPNCGKDNQPDQKFCRHCGMSLLQVTQALTDFLGEAASDGKNRREKLERFGRRAGLAGTALLAVLILSLLSGATLFGLDIDSHSFLRAVVAPALSLAFLGIFGGAGLLIYAAEFRRRHSPEIRSHLESGPPAITNPVVATSLPEPQPSVTEVTTRNLDPSSGSKLSSNQ